VLEVRRRPLQRAAGPDQLSQLQRGGFCGHQCALRLVGILLSLSSSVDGIFVMVLCACCGSRCSAARFAASGAISEIVFCSLLRLCSLPCAKGTFAAVNGSSVCSACGFGHFQVIGCLAIPSRSPITACACVWRVSLTCVSISCCSKPAVDCSLRSWCCLSLGVWASPPLLCVHLSGSRRADGVPALRSGSLCGRAGTAGDTLCSIVLQSFELPFFHSCQV
jgi:hypothetical protein